MRIALTDLHDYVEGILRFEWIEVDGLTEDELQEIITAFLRKRSEETGELHEEWFVTDYEDFPNLGEYPDVAEMVMVAKLCGQHNWKAVEAWLQDGNTSEGFEEAFQGVHESEEEFAAQLIEDCYNLDYLMGSLACYFDYERFARDLFIGDYFSSEVNEGVAVFRRL